MQESVRAGFVGFGEVNTPRETIERKCADARTMVEGAGIEIVWADPVSDDPQGADAQRAVETLQRADFDFVIICMAGWIPSYVVVRVLEPFRHLPVLLFGLSGFMEGDRLISTADQAGTTALRKPLVDMGFNVKFVYLSVDGEPPVKSIVDFSRAASAARRLRNARIGSMSYADMKLYGTLYDGVSLRRRIGPEVEVFDMLEIEREAEKAGGAEIKQVVDANVARWVFENQAADETISRGVRYYLALSQKIKARHYDALTLIDVDGMKKHAHFTPAMIFMLIAEREQIPTVPENDIPGAVTQLMVAYLTGQIAPYVEIYEFFRDRILFGVPDYVPPEAIEGSTTVTSTRFGEFSEGVLNVSRMKTGTVTLCRLVNDGDRYQMHLLTGKAHPPRSWQEAGWSSPAPQLPSLEIEPEGGVAEFAEKVMSQHYIIAYGNHTGAIRELCSLLGVEIV